MIRPQLWTYFLSLEADLSRCQRYIAFTEAHLDVHSIEFGKILVLTGSELDGALKVLAEKVDPGAKRTNITEYEKTVSQRFPLFKEMSLVVKGTNLQFSPWRMWTPSKSPDWWSGAYNGIKHHRTEKYQLGTLGNCMNALGALYLVLLHIHLGELRLPDRRAMAFTPHLFMPVNHPLDTRYEYAFAGSPFDAIEAL